MAKPIAGVNRYPYGKCGYTVGGALLKPDSRKKNMRIYKQRSIDMFDLLDPVTGEVYQKVQLTGYNIKKEPLDYSMSDDEILRNIKPNSFFVRGYDTAKDHFGFVIRFLTHKKVLSNGIILYDMYIPTCENNRDVGTIIVDTVIVGDTAITGAILNSTGILNTDSMIVVLTMPDGSEYTTNVVNGLFTFDNLVIDAEGTGTITVQSPNYDTKSVDFVIKPDGTDSDFVTIIPVQNDRFIPNGDGTYNISIPATDHNRGANLVVQLQTFSGQIIDGTVVVDSTGDLTITVSDTEIFNVLIIGDTTLNKVHVESLSWTLVGSMYEMDIPFATHGKENTYVDVYDGNTIVQCEVIEDSSFNIKLRSLESFSGKVVIAGSI